MSKINQKTVRTAQLALLAAIIAVLQQIVIPLPGGLTLTLTLVPIVVGAVLYGAGAGAILGGVFGLVVSVMAIQGRLGVLTNMMVAYNPVVTVAVCMLKGIAAGWVAGLVNGAFKKRPLIGIFAAAAAAPLANTGIFVAGMLTVFRGVMQEFADGIGMGSMNAVYFAIVVLVGVNFLVEFAANLLLSPTIASIVKGVKKIGK